MELFISEDEESKGISVDLSKFVVIIPGIFNEEISFVLETNSEEIFGFSLSLVVESSLDEIK